jgi:hypothetical protein
MTVLTSSVLTFLFNQNMNHEDILKEMHNKVHTCTLPNKLTIQAMICITMTYEDLYATQRAAASAANVVYVSHTMVEDLALIDRPTHLTYVAAVTATVAIGHPVPTVIPFSEALTDAHMNSKAFLMCMLLSCIGMWCILGPGTVLLMLHRLFKLRTASLL